MTAISILHYCAAGLCGGVALFALLRDHRSFVHRIFVVGMAALALESLFMGLSARVVLPEQAVEWQVRRLLVTALLPGIWLLFCLSFGREGNRPLATKWKWVILTIFLVHLILGVLFQADLFRRIHDNFPDGWVFELGWSGFLFYLCFLLSLVLLMMLLEGTLRASKGWKRWQVKFFVLGIGGFFAACIYTAGHILVFQLVDLEFEIINAVILIASNLLIIISIMRAGVLRIDVYFSQKVLYNSLTVMLVGVYFLALGLSTTTLDRFLSFPLRVLLIFLALIVLMIALFSDRLRLRLKRFVNRQFRRPRYDYRNVWMNITERTASLLEEKQLCEAVAKMISEMFDILSVSFWLLDKKRGSLRCAASTARLEIQVENLSRLKNLTSDLKQLLQNQQNLLDLAEPTAIGTAETEREFLHLFQESRIRYLILLSVDNDLLGCITLGDRVGGKSLSFEALEILKTIADQVAVNLLNLKLGEELRQAKEMEAFQTVAAFFVHDFKNLASKLSMMLQNMRVHIDNPAFRDEALHLLSRSLEQVNALSSRLSLLREKLEIQPHETDLNDLVSHTLAGFDGLTEARILKNLQSVPMVFVDPKQITKVLTNLILNAREAIGNGGEISVTTGVRKNWVELTVNDNGCGISSEFLDRSLFRPFRTTKKHGTGIGLFQSKLLVEAHNGLIEVESQEGQGSTFRVLLPVSRK